MVGAIEINRHEFYMKIVNYVVKISRKQGTSFNVSWIYIRYFTYFADLLHNLFIYETFSTL